MTNYLRIHCAQRLPECLNDSQTPLRPYVQVFGVGAERYFIGKTNHDNSQWKAEFSFPFTHAYLLELELYHYKFIGKDILIGKGVIDLRTIQLSTLVDIPLINEVEGPIQPILTVQIEFCSTDLPKLVFKKTEPEYLYVCATFDPPMQFEPPEIIPVEFKLLNFEKDGSNATLLQTGSDWSYVGSSTNYQLARVPGGWSQIHRISKEIVKNTYTHMILCPHAYTGEVEVNIIMTNKEKPMRWKYANNWSYDLKKTHVLATAKINVAAGVPCTSTFFISNFDNLFKIENCDSVMFYEESLDEFHEHAIKSVIQKDLVLRYRYIGPFSQSYTYSVSNKFSVIIGSMHKGEKQSSIHYDMYDSNFNTVKALFQSRFKTEETIELSEEEAIKLRFIDFQKLDLNLEKIPKKCSIIVFYAPVLNNTYSERYYMRFLDQTDNNEVNFSIMHGNSDSKIFCAAALARDENTWNFIPIQKYSLPGVKPRNSLMSDFALNCIKNDPRLTDQNQGL